MSGPVWQFAGQESWHDFDARLSVELENQLQSGAASASIVVGTLQYHIDFTQMKQRRVGDPTRARPLRRVDRTGAPIGPRTEADTLSDSFFWAAFQQAMRQVGITSVADPHEVFDFSQNRDYRGLKDTGHLAKRGREAYKIPVGWKRFAVKVAGKYDGGDNTWMRSDGKAGEWAVAYHGTKYASIGSILAREGLKAGPGQACSSTCGVGIYCTPDLAVALGYATQVQVTAGGQTHAMQFILQCRVRPEAIRRGAATIWVINNPRDIRPYGVLCK